MKLLRQCGNAVGAAIEQDDVARRQRARHGQSSRPVEDRDQLDPGVL